MKVFKAKYFLLPLLALGLTYLQSCKDEDGDINFFSVSDDLAFGAQTAAQIDSDPSFNILDSASNVAAYKYIYDVRNGILNTNLLTFKDRFPWRIRIVKDDTTLNAFCTPGGYIYFYTGLIKFLDYESELAGVMGHEMAHADKRHSTDALTRQYGISLMLDIVFGQDKGQLARIAAGLKDLQYSRKNESEADEYSVIWLNSTDWDAKGAAGFFQKLIDQGQSGGTPQFLSTHPDPGNRVEARIKKWEELGSKPGQQYQARYTNFKALL
jgi:beta-barrel assembly-enhancing protease